MEIYQIDASKKALGRVATEAATVLRGKNLPSFRPHLLPNVRVEIVNASKLRLPKEKRMTKTYSRYSGYPGGLKKVSMEKVIEKHGYAGPLRLAVRGMLPKNKLQGLMMTRLTIKE